jgi:hypothetical protein
MKTNQRNLIYAYQQAPWRVQLHMVGVFSLVLVMIGLVAGIYLNVTARAATIGREILEMQEDILMLERINADLETKLASLTSIESMELRAQELGFRPLVPGESHYLLVSGYRGRQVVKLAPPPGPVLSSIPDLPPEFTQTLYDWLREFTLQPTDVQRSNILQLIGFARESGSDVGLSP